MPDAEQRDDERMPPRLLQDALARIDEDHREVGIGGAGRHVAGVLLVAGRVGNDELASFGGEEAVGDIDGDALFALGLQPVDKQGEVERLALGAVFARILAQRRRLVLEHPFGVVQQAADQRRLSVVDAAAGQKAKEPLLVVFAEKVDHGRGNGRQSLVHDGVLRNSLRVSSFPWRPPRHGRSAGPSARKYGRSASP